MPKFTIYRMKGDDELPSYLAPDNEATLHELQSDGLAALLAVEVRTASLPEWAGWLLGSFEDAEFEPAPSQGAVVLIEPTGVSLR